MFESQLSFQWLCDYSTRRSMLFIIRLGPTQGPEYALENIRQLELLHTNKEQQLCLQSLSATLWQHLPNTACGS